MRWVVRTSLVGLVAVGLVAPGAAQATVVTVGSPMTATFSPGPAGGAATFLNTGLPELGASVTSPVTGVVVRWRIEDAIGGPYRLRVLTPVDATHFTGAGSSTAQTSSNNSLQTFPTNLPIKAGQTIGIDTTNAGDTLGAASIGGAGFGVIAPPVADGSSGTVVSGGANTELAFNADVATVPSNSYSFDGVALNKKNGTATLAVVVPGPGTLALTGKGVKTQRTARGATASRAVSGAGVVNLLIKAKGKTKTKLNKTGRAKVKVKVTYTPSGDAPGVPLAKTKSVKLLKG